MHLRKFIPFTFFVLILVFLHSEQLWSDEFKITPSLHLKNEYNDNIFFDDEDDENIDDYIVTLSPGLKVSDRIDRLSTYISSRFDFIKYDENFDLDDTEQFYDGNFRYRITPRMNILTRARYTQDSRIDRDIEESGLIVGTSTRYRQNYDASWDYMLTEKALTTASYTYTQDDFDNNDDHEFIDSRSQNGTIGFSYSLESFLPNTFARINVGYELFSFDDSIIDEVRSSSLMIGATKNLNEKLAIILDIGKRYTVSEYLYTDETSTTRGMLGNITLKYNGEFTTVRLTAYQDLGTASGESGAIERRSLKLSIERRLSEELHLGLTSEYFSNKTDRDSYASDDIDEETLRINPWVRYNFTRDIDLEGSYVFTKLQDHEDEEKAYRNIFFIRLRIQLPIIL